MNSAPVTEDVPGHGTPVPVVRPDDDLLVDAMRRVPLRCAFCEYDLRAAVSVVCPECGRNLTWKDFQDDRQMPNSRFVVLSLMGISMWLVGSLLAAVFVVLVGFRSRVPAMVAELALLLCVAGAVVSAWLLYKWGTKPRRLLTYGGGRVAAIKVFVVPAGVLVILLCPAMLLAFAWVLRYAWF